MTQAKAYLVIAERGGLGAVCLDHDLAHKIAQATESVVAEIPITADYRKGPQTSGASGLTR